MPTTLVHRLELMRLLYRFKGLLEWELARLAALDGDTVPLDLPEPPVVAVRRLEPEPPSIAPGTPGATGEPTSVPDTSARPGAETPDGALADFSRPAGAPLSPLQQIRVPTNLESCCRSAELPARDYAELVDAATPYVRALAEK